MQRLQVIFEDDFIVVIDKPPGITVDLSETSQGITLSEILQKDFHISLDRGGIAHRLDKDTSGVLIATKTQDALENLQAQFKNREIKKEYTALVHGFLMEAEGVISGALTRNPLNREKFMVAEGGKEAETSWEIISSFQLQTANFQSVFGEFNKIQLRKLRTMHYEQFALIKCFPKTGRTHQIRVHLKYISHPIVSDGKYGGRKITRLDKRWCPRQFLHATRLEIRHPENDRRMVFESPLPQDLEKALGYLTPITI